MRKVGRYEILDEIGHGGQSVAYKARDPKIDRVVAIKQIRSAEGMSPRMRDEFYARFMREAQAAGRLSHPNIATIYDVGGDEEGEPYIAMEFIDGMNLDDLLEKERLLPPDKAIQLFTQLCSALDYAHQHGIVHRDIKPGNVMLTRAGQVKVVDFGIAKLTSSNLTQAGTVMGTPSYMSPEQIMGKSVDHRSDIFSLGVVLYEALTGEKPFVGDNPSTIIFKIVNEQHQPVHQCRPTLIAGFDTILDSALAKHPAARYQRCHDFARDLEKLSSIHAEGKSHSETIATAPTSMFSTQDVPSGRTRAGSPDPATTDRTPKPRTAAQPAALMNTGIQATVLGTPAALSSDAPQSASQPGEASGSIQAGVGKPGGSKTWFAVAAGILLLAAAVGAYFWMNTGSTPETVESGAGTVAGATATPMATTAAPPATTGNVPAQQAATQVSRPENKPRISDVGGVAEAPAAAEAPGPQKPSDYFDLGKSLEEQKNLPAAIDNYRHACELEPKNATYAIHLALALQKNRSLKGAVNYLERAIALGGDPEHTVASLKTRLDQIEKQAALAGALPYNAQVRHDHMIGKGCDGKLSITEAGIRFVPVKQMDHALQAPLTAIKSISLKKSRMEVILTSGKKYSFDVPDPAPVQKIVDGWK